MAWWFSELFSLLLPTALCVPSPVAVLGQCRNSTEPRRLPTTEEEQIYPWDTCAALHDVRLTTLQRYFKDVSIATRLALNSNVCKR